MADYRGIEALCDGHFLGDGSYVNGSAVPNFTECFRHTVLVFIPCAFFWVLLPAFLAQSFRAHLNSRFSKLPWTPLLFIKLIITMCLLFDAIFVLASAIYDGSTKDIAVINYIYPSLLAATMFGISMCIVLAMHQGMVTSGILHLTWVLLAICGAPEFYAFIQQISYSSLREDVSMARCVAYFVWYPLVLIQTFLFSFADRLHQSDIEERKKLNRSQELESSFLNRLTLWWFNAIPVLGSRKALEVEDLFNLNEGNTSKFLIPKWERLWLPALEKYNMRKKIQKSTKSAEVLYKEKPQKDTLTEGKKETLQPPSIVWVLFRMFKYEIISATGTKMLSDSIQFASPFLLHELIGFISHPHSPLWKGIAFSVAMFACSETRSFLLNYYFYLMQRVSIKIQTSLTAAVYKKTLKLTSGARRLKTVGEIVNLMAIDIDRFQLITPQIQQFWSCPFQITLALIYLFYTLGASAACGVAVMTLFLPTNIICSILVKKWQMQQMKLKDERAKMCNEILNGVKVIKLYAWEPPMEEAVENIRKKELLLVKKAGLVRAIIHSLNVASPFLVALLTFTAYTLSSSEHVLTPQVAFVSLTLFNQLRSPMTMIALLIQQTVQAVVANKRLKEFLVADELSSTTIERSLTQTTSNINSVEIRNASFIWDSAENNSAPIIRDVNLKVPRGNLMAIVGRVGCGKSSLLSALLGEMEKLRGYVGVRGRVAYVPQQPWIQNLSLRENITFGRPFDQNFYDRVIEACALVQDIAILPQGDSTEIGEKGINLSGGQKARVSLARAVYQNYDLYLLDDPLSAVDSHVGKHIFDKVIGPRGLLKHKTRILVTHAITFLRDVDTVAVVKDGTVSEVGTLDELMSNGGEFAEFIKECGKDRDEESRISEESPEEIEYSEDSSNTEYGLSEELETDEVKAELYRQISTVSDLAEEAAILRSKASSQRASRKRSSVTPDKKKSLANGKSVEPTKPPGALIGKEKAETGRIQFSVYTEYIHSATYYLAGMFLLLFIAYSAFQLGRGIWLSKWSDSNDKKQRTQNSTDEIKLGVRLGVYAALGFTENANFFMSSIFLIFAGVHASRNLHRPLLHNLMRSPMSFFDTTPIGRILNRFGKDIDVIDQLLPLNFRLFVMSAFNVICTLTIIIISTPIFAAIILPLAIIYYASLRFYVPTSRQMKRLESVNRSPIYSHFGESIQGAASIRAFDKVGVFCELSESRVDRFVRCKYLNLMSNRWLAVRLEFVGNCVVLFAALFAVLSREWGVAITAGAAGLSVSYALNITDTLSFAVRQVSEMETNIVAVERVKEYAETPTEAPWTVDGRSPEKGWPTEGRIELRDYSTRYRDGLDLVVKRLNATIESAQKIGIVGRTGAGKSSLALALFRMIEPVEGEIIIDGVNIATIGLHDLRSNLTIIPQDPMLFSGSLRFNLDPFGRHDDHEIWEALELAHLKPFAMSLEEGLGHRISEGGENISVGQRQLVCLARAVLRKSRVLILDEATAAVDLATDALIQETIRREFKSSTVLTIAHRLNTILDYDRVMVLDDGRIVEFESPQSLLANRSSLFYAMAVDANIVA